MPKSATQKPSGNSTSLQLHIAFQGLPAEDRRGLVDFSEKKLRAILRKLFSAEKRVQVMELIEKYTTGQAAVGWRAGVPIFSEVKKDV